MPGRDDLLSPGFWVPTRRLDCIHGRGNALNPLADERELIRTGQKHVPTEGVEPTRPCGHWILSPARLPIPPRRHWESRTYKHLRQAQLRDKL